MTPRTAAFLVTGICALVLAVHSHAAEAKKAPDPDLPQPLDLSVTQPLLKNSPFTRSINLADQLALTGIAYVQGKPVATLMDRNTKKSYLVSETPNAEGWRLAEASASSDIKRSEVKIIVGTETVAIRYGNTQVAPPKKGYMPSKIPTAEEFTGKDEKGAYVRGMPYLNDEDRERFRGSISREVREKFLQIVHDKRDMLFKASHEERAAFVKKALNAAEGK